MPLNVKRLCACFSLVLLLSFGLFAQTPTSGDVMRARISKAKALVAVKNYAAAIYELEGIKRETNEPTVNVVVHVMLMNCYLEQLDYKRAQSLLSEIYKLQKTNKPEINYYAVAGQVVKGAKNQLDRYKSLGLSVADRNLPTEASADVEKMRETVEMVITQSKDLAANKKFTSDSMALVEEAGTARSGLARDEFDSKRWKEEISDAREQLMSSRTTIINSVDDGMPNIIDASKILASNNAPIITMTPDPSSLPAKPAVTETAKVNEETKPAAKTENVGNAMANMSEQIDNTIVIGVRKREVEDPKTSANVAQPVAKESTNDTPPVDNSAKIEPQQNVVGDGSPLQIGSLLEYATARVAPTYPPAAKTMRMTGTVKVEVLLNEDGSIAEVQKTSGPSMLQRAAVDAVKRWKFKPFVRDGQPVKASGFVSFNFNL